MTSLDSQIANALAALAQNPRATQFDYAAYIRCFQQSARAKVDEVLLELNDKTRPFAKLRPVFVSVGGGDGEELANLLRRSDAQRGVLLEQSRELANLARDRNQGLQPKAIEVIEGDAQDRIEDAIRIAAHFVEEKLGDFIAVSCHAVIHELFDRGRSGFDTVAFFGSIFSSEFTTWFTYREPGAPEKWPPTVLLSAACSPRSLCDLASAISNRHSSFRSQIPAPMVVGDHVRLHKSLAMEVLAKLFYVNDLHHEIEERSTAVDHGTLASALWLAIGTTARQERRAQINTSSKATGSFIDHWQQLGVEVLGLGDNSSTWTLPIAESQTRLVAWRLQSEDTQVISEDLTSEELRLTRDALTRRDEPVLSALISSRARAWIETSSSSVALGLLREVMTNTPQCQPAHLWAHFCTCISKLFAGQKVDPDWFSGEIYKHAENAGLALLFRAECMEFNRKCDNLSAALSIANELSPILNSTGSLAPGTDSYVLGTANFLMGNFLRHGGQYDLASKYIERAQSIYQQRLPSHETELAHCHYSKQVCTAMTGNSAFDASFTGAPDSKNRRFANALITLSYSHAAWFLRDAPRAKDFADEAARRFQEIDYTSYAARARNLSALLGVWLSESNQVQPDYSQLDNGLARIVRALAGHQHNTESLCTALANLRPSLVIGLLQFAEQFGNWVRPEAQVAIPGTLCVIDGTVFSWQDTINVKSLAEGNGVLRARLGIPLQLRVPLLAD